eukprot:7277884-Pyramimonas_sp.AAC.1
MVNPIQQGAGANGSGQVGNISGGQSQLQSQGSLNQQQQQQQFLQQQRLAAANQMGGMRQQGMQSPQLGMNGQLQGSMNGPGGSGNMLNSSGGNLMGQGGMQTQQQMGYNQGGNGTLMQQGNMALNGNNSNMGTMNPQMLNRSGGSMNAGMMSNGSGMMSMGNMQGSGGMMGGNLMQLLICTWNMSNFALVTSETPAVIYEPSKGYRVLITAAPCVANYQQQQRQQQQIGGQVMHSSLVGNGG